MIAINFSGFLLSLAIIVSSAFTHSALAQTAETTTDRNSLESALAAEFANKTEAAVSKLEKNRLSLIAEYYASNNNELLWVHDGQLTQRARAVLEVTRRADEHALDPEEYFITPLLGRSPEQQAQFDISLSNAVVAYAQHLNAGRVNPESVNRENVIYPEAISPARILREATSTTNVAAYLRLLAPRTPRYERLRLALQDYWALADAGGWEKIPDLGTVEPGIADARVPALRRRLAISGDYLGDPDNISTLYEGDIVEAVIAFQKRHGLEQDGVVEAATFRELNVTVEERIAMMELNLERRRWMQDEYGRYHVFANLADQVLKVVRDNKTIHAEIITIGSPENRIPVFTGKLKRVEINPYWNVPQSIAIKELLPVLQNTPEKLDDEGYEVLSGDKVLRPNKVAWRPYSQDNFPFRLRQRPGANNAAGRINFVFPNGFDVHIKDAAGEPLDNESLRFASSGALQLNVPLKMAEVILKEKDWDRKKIEKAIQSGETTVIKLGDDIPVHIAYMTAWVNKDGSIHFRRDVYGRDQALFDALARIRS